VAQFSVKNPAHFWVKINKHCAQNVKTAAAAMRPEKLSEGTQCS
jgi:hypothetical protein